MISTTINTTSYEAVR